jgi:hypothetical protein
VQDAKETLASGIKAAHAFGAHGVLRCVALLCACAWSEDRLAHPVGVRSESEQYRKQAVRVQSA